MRRHGVSVDGKRILHFSPERPFFRQWKNLPDYVAGDIKRSSVSNAIVDITAIQFDDEWFDIVICHHVLEHVPDDVRGIQECFRVLKKDGIAFFSVPMDRDRPETWEPPQDMPKAAVEAICGWDHVRLYGRDFPSRLSQAGFLVEEIMFSEADADQCRLSWNGVDQVFVARKPVAQLPRAAEHTIPSHSPF
jgi:SAM-dependent methyltransferase